jgi:hypothetical protein
VALYIQSPSTPPWRGAQLKHRDFTFTFTRNKNWLAINGSVNRDYYEYIDWYDDDDDDDDDDNNNFYGLQYKACTKCMHEKD